MKCEAGVVSVSQISTWFIFIEAASSCKVLANMLLAGRRGGEEWEGQDFLERAQGSSPTYWDGAKKMELHERKVKFHRDKWLSYYLGDEKSEGNYKEQKEEKVKWC